MALRAQDRAIGTATDGWSPIATGVWQSGDVGRWYRPGTPRYRAALSLVTGALLAAACGIPTATGPVSTGAAHPASTSPTPAVASTTFPPAPPVSPVAWAPCSGTLQCGSVAVPLDYAHPSGPMISIAVARRPASDPSQRIGSLVINPGGPGSSGIGDLANELSVLTPGLVDHFDIVSFDPRGVQRSSPVTCSGPSGSPTTAPGSPVTTVPGSPAELTDPVPTTPAAVKALVAGDRRYAAQCQRVSGKILPFVSTEYAAYDLDRIRQALGDAQLTFIGHSYGTLLGATYAQLFPTHVRAMVLDGALDPAESTQQMATEQAESFEANLGSFFAWCASTASCAWRPEGDPTAAVLALIAQSRVQPLPAGGTAVAGPADFYYALVAGLGATSDWPRLGAAVAQAAAGNGTGVAQMADAYTSGGSSNATDAERAIDCLDHPVPAISAFPAMAAQAAVQAPVFGPLLIWTWAGCAVWPVKATRTPAPTTAVGSPSILVTGTLHDPVTPYRWAVSLAGELQHGVLVTWDGSSHVAYFYSPCIRAIDQAYLLDGTVPAAGTSCSD
jgi:pimeloyl-ACP methyl ester carboxylesterase